MAKFTKPLKTIEIVTALAEAISVNDEPRDAQASMALSQFLDDKMMVFKDGETTVYVPFHAVNYLQSIVEQAQVDRPDPYGCKGGGNPSESNIVCEGEACKMTLE